MAGHRIFVGKRAEDIALNHLLSSGYSLLARNWRCPYGEIDIVMSQGDIIVFVEVRARNIGVEEAFLSVDVRKRYKLSRAMNAYLAQHYSEDVDSRLDIIAVRFDNGYEHGVLSHAQDVLTW